jgi:hypothetical protein
MTRWAESPGAAREHDEPLLGAVRTPDAGKPAARIAAVEVAVHDLLDDRPEEAILLLEAALILRQESVEVMKYHPVECSPFRMSRAIDSRHGGRKASRNGPMSHIGPRLPGKREEPRLQKATRARKRQQPLPLVGGNGKRKGLFF